MSEQVTRFYVDKAGRFLGAYVGGKPPVGSVEVALPPEDGRQIWANGAWQSAPVVLAQVKAECKRRIFAAASAATQSNMNGYMSLLNAKALSGQTLTTGEQADVGLFTRAMAWIEAMRGACAALVGDQDYKLDEKWPVLDADLAAFAARF